VKDRIQRLFDQAASLAPEQRSAFLDAACADDEALRRGVDALLARHVAAGADPSVPRASDEPADSSHDDTIVGPSTAPETVISASTTSAISHEGPGTVIGHYRLLQQIGEGGFGVVFLAEQKEPVKRRVALKIIKLGMDTRQVIARFGAERQALAMMDHPNIARVLDAGATETGRPYFVMELVKGVPITEYCDRNSLTVRERLELMIPVCLAIQHAHQKGIIHRDLKPSNVLVTMHDGKPTPKVIDFGIAKATTSDLTEMTVYTEYRQFIGTPEYMSPEQAEMSGLDIDTRSDVYALGVLLYVLVTGATPFDPKTLRSKGPAELQRMIVETDTPRPSTRLSMLGETISVVARHRQVDPNRLRSLVRGELDWIALKAMEKDRTRRYETARDFADDIQRFLDDEPIRAAPPSRMYLLRKLARRHRAAAAIVAVVAAALVLTAIGTSWGMIRAIAAERAAVAAVASEAEQRSRAEANEGRAIAAAARAEREAERALAAERSAEARTAELELMTAFQTSMIQTIDVARMSERMRDDVVTEIRSSMERMELPEAEIDVRMAQAEALLAAANFSNPAIRSIERTILARAARQIDEQFADQPMILARLLRSVAETRAVLGFGIAAERDFRRVSAIHDELLGPDDPQSIVALALVAGSMSARGDWLDAAEVYREAHDRATEALGADHALTKVIGYMVLGGNIDPILRQRDPEQVHWWAEITIGVSRVEAELAAEYVPRIFEILDQFGLDEDTDTESIDDATLDAVMDAFEEVFAILRDNVGDSNPLLVSFKSNVGRNARTMGRPLRGEPYLREALETQRRMFGDAHPATVFTMLEYSQLLFDLDRRDESYALSRQGLAAIRRAHGPEHPLTLQVLDLTARNLLTAGEDSRAVEYLRSIMEIQRRTLADEPEALAAAFAVRSSDLLELRHPATLELVGEMLEECLELRTTHLPESWLTANARSMFGESQVWRATLGAADDPTAALLGARQLLLDGYEGLAAADDAEAPAVLPARRRRAAERLVRVCELLHEHEPDAGHDADAERWRKRVEALRAAQQPPAME